MILLLFFFFRDNNDVLAVMSLQLDKAAMDKGRSLNEVEDEEIEKIIKDSLLSGRVGALKVDPASLVFEPQSSKCIRKKKISEENYR